MAPPSLSSSHLLITSSLPKPSSLRPPRIPLSSKPIPALLLALAAAPTLPALAVDAPAQPPAPTPQLQGETPTPAANPFADTLLTAPKPSAASADLPDGGQWRYSEFLGAVKKGKVELDAAPINCTPKPAVNPGHADVPVQDCAAFPMLDLLSQRRNKVRRVVAGVGASRRATPARRAGGNRHNYCRSPPRAASPHPRASARPAPSCRHT